MKYINIIRHSKMFLYRYRPRSEWIITDRCCPRNIYFASKLQGALTYCCYFPLYPPFFEKYTMKNHIHKCSRVTLWHTVTTYNEILTYRCQRIDQDELSLDDVWWRSLQVASRSLQNIFPKGFQLNGQELRSRTIDCGMCTWLLIHFSKIKIIFPDIGKTIFRYR